MTAFRIVLIMVVWALAGPVLPQTGERESTPPGTSQGEMAGMPNQR